MWPSCVTCGAASLHRAFSRPVALGVPVGCLAAVIHHFGVHRTWTSKDWNRRSEADQESLLTLSVPTLRVVLEVSNVALVFYLLWLHPHLEFLLHACLN